MILCFENILAVGCGLVRIIHFIDIVTIYVCGSEISGFEHLVLIIALCESDGGRFRSKRLFDGAQWIRLEAPFGLGLFQPWQGVEGSCLLTIRRVTSNRWVPEILLLLFDFCL